MVGTTNMDVQSTTSIKDRVTELETRLTALEGGGVRDTLINKNITNCTDTSITMDFSEIDLSLYSEIQIKFGLDVLSPLQPTSVMAVDYTNIGLKLSSDSESSIWAYYMSTNTRTNSSYNSGKTLTSTTDTIPIMEKGSSYYSISAVSSDIRIPITSQSVRQLIGESCWSQAIEIATYLKDGYFYKYSVSLIDGWNGESISIPTVVKSNQSSQPYNYNIEVYGIRR